MNDVFRIYTININYSMITSRSKLYILSTVRPRYSAFQGTGHKYALYQGFHYYQLINNYENDS